ncbi:MAG: hypothetical protein ACPLXC_01275 [Candidatus Pacearchaeota archaeon]
MIKMRLFLFVLFIGIFLFSLASMGEVKANIERHAAVDILLLNQDPYPAGPNNYVELVFKIENKGGVDVHDVLVELLPEYPFSLDAGINAVKKVGSLTLAQYGKKAVFVKYKVRVDKDAVDGENPIKIRYVYDTNGQWINYVTREYNVTVEDTITDFDVAIQDYSPVTGTLSIAISNTGKQNANSVTISLPEQSSIEVIGSNKEIVGGIETNDYTVSSFKVVPKEDALIVVHISYTDSIGIRREIDKAVLFKASTYSYKTAAKEAGVNNRALIYIGIGVVGIAIIIVLFRILRKKRK